MAAPTRHFELTIGVFGPIGAGDEWEIPDTFNDWLVQAFGLPAVKAMGASPTTLLRVVETRYSLANDIIERRKRDGVKVQHS